MVKNLKNIFDDEDAKEQLAKIKHVKSGNKKKYPL